MKKVVEKKPVRKTVAKPEPKVEANALVVKFEVADALLKYLDTRPHGESRQFIDAIQGCQRIAVD